jgi:YVTN family beta-propeller protein
VRALLLLAAGSLPASAQIGGPQQAKPEPAAAGTAREHAPASATGVYEKDGVRILFSVKANEKGGEGLVAGTDAVVTFSVTDARSGQPLAGVRPRAWISSRRSEEAAGEQECRDKIRTFMGGLLSARPDHDLNSYLLLTLNHDNTISVINPLVSFSRTQLESLITLPAAGADWALSENGALLYVTLPERSEVAVVSTISRKIIGTVSTGEKTRPMRIAIQPGGRYVWVGLDNSGGVAVIDASTNNLAATIETGAGLHNITFSGDGRFAYVTNSAAHTVSAIDARRLAKVADVTVGQTPVPVAYSPASGLLYVAALNGSTVSVIDPASHRVVKSIPVGRGVVALRFDPTGRFGFAVSQVENSVAVIDSAMGEVVGRVPVVKGPDQVTFTNRYAYVRGTGSEKFSLIELSGVASGRFTAVDVTAGQKPASALPGEVGVADMIATTPEGNAAMIANTPDGMIYYYVEGMMAPMGTLSNYKRRPQAALILDRSLAEVSPGVYMAPVRLKGAGRFDVSVLTGQPRITHCFQMEVADSPNAAKASARVSLSVRPLFEGRQFRAGDSVRLRFKVTDSSTGQPVEGLEDVQVLAFEPPGVWQQRQWAREVGKGEYEVSQTFPRPGSYNVMVRSASRGVSYADLPHVSVQVTSGEAETDKANN